MGPTLGPLRFPGCADGRGEKFGPIAPPIASTLISQPLSGYTTPILVGQSLLKRSLSPSSFAIPLFPALHFYPFFSATAPNYHKPALQGKKQTHLLGPPCVLIK